MNGDLTDFILRHPEGDIKIHRVVICSQSKVLLAACKGSFQVRCLALVTRKFTGP